MITYTSDPKPRLTLVGAGPGDPELITLKAINTLRSANIVLYDALVAPEILKFIPDRIPSIEVGKRAGKHSYSQQEINELIVESALAHGHVVRLKGGDPFVFGRATEELEVARLNGIPAEVIPGISSSIAVPASIGIPVTARGVSESFWVVTGTTREGILSADIALAAKSTATVVVLMGLKKIHEIMDLFAAEGKSDTPVAVIQNGTLANQKSVVGTVESMVRQLTEEIIGSPAVIVIGEVVRYTDHFKLAETYAGCSLSAATMKL
jgi:uroporphyrin-III C-methyltransferase